MGGALLQNLNRDSLKFAMKANHAVVGGHGRDVSKNPVTDRGKRSKAGRQYVTKRAGMWSSSSLPPVDPETNCLITRFAPGIHPSNDDFETIRRRAEIAPPGQEG